MACLGAECTKLALETSFKFAACLKTSIMKCWGGSHINPFSGVTYLEGKSRVCYQSFVVDLENTQKYRDQGQF